MNTASNSKPSSSSSGVVGKPSGAPPVRSASPPRAIRPAPRAHHHHNILIGANTCAASLHSHYHPHHHHDILIGANTCAVSLHLHYRPHHYHDILMRGNTCAVSLYLENPVKDVDPRVTLIFFLLYEIQPVSHRNNIHIKLSVLTSPL